MIEKRKVMREVEDDIRICDRCKEDMEPDGVYHQIVFHGHGYEGAITDSIQGKWVFDCCQQCMQEVAAMFGFTSGKRPPFPVGTL